MDLNDLEVYKEAREISSLAWKAYVKLDSNANIIVGNQFIRSIDSVGANIAEGFGRYHYLDRNKFNYNARGSLREGLYWTEIMYERDKINKIDYDNIFNLSKNLLIRLSNYIESTKKLKYDQQ